MTKPVATGAADSLIPEWAPPDGPLRAANWLAIGQSYLRANPLLKRPLALGM
jgi:hypothetical protein